MAAPSLTEAQMREAWELVSQHGGVMPAARVTGLTKAVLENRYFAAVSRLGLPPIGAKPPTYGTPYQAPEPPPDPVFEKPRVRMQSDGGEIRVLAIGDVHAGPGMPTEHLGWIARHAIETNPAHLVQIGDFGDWASCSQHEGNETVKGRLKPSFAQDEEAVYEAYEALYGPIDAAGLQARRWQTDGNHEYRVDKFVNAHPELQGDWDIRMRQLPARYSVERKEYGAWLFLGGVGFTHHPVNQLGRAYGGKTSENQIANDATFSIVSGHSHKGLCVHRPKIGPDNRVTVLNLGTAMVDGYVPPYAQWSTTGWTYGVWNIRIAAGRITDHSFVSMNELQRRYG
jgi:hypothetical protein